MSVPQVSTCDDCEALKGDEPHCWGYIFVRCADCNKPVCKACIRQFGHKRVCADCCKFLKHQYTGNMNAKQQSRVCEVCDEDQALARCVECGVRICGDCTMTLDSTTMCYECHQYVTKVSTKDKKPNWSDHKLIDLCLDRRTSSDASFVISNTLHTERFPDASTAPDIDGDLYELEVATDVNELLRPEMEQLQELQKKATAKLLEALRKDANVIEFHNMAVLAEEFKQAGVKHDRKSARRALLRKPEYQRARDYFKQRPDLEVGEQMREFKV